MIDSERDDYMNQEEMGKFIASCRKSKNMTQDELSEKLRVDRTTISKWERGVTSPDISVLIDLCRELDISITELFECKKRNEKNSEQDEVTIKAIKFYENKTKNRILKLMLLIVLLITICVITFITSSWYNKYNLIYLTTESENIIVNGNIIYNNDKQIIMVKDIELVDNIIGTDKEINVKKMTTSLLSNNIELYKQSIEYEKSKYISYAFDDINIYYDSSKSETKNRVDPQKTKIIVEVIDDKNDTFTYMIDLKGSN